MADLLQKTSRREAREGYVRFLLTRANLSEEDVESYLSTVQASLENRSLLNMIYTGEYERAVRVVETFVDSNEIIQKEVVPV